MNKLTKIGASALCGSLAAVSAASAGELTVKGGATATWSSNEGTVTGNPIGLSSGITMTGSGELDNGTTFSLTLTQADQSGYSAGNITMTTPSLGSFRIGQTGGGLDRFDDMMPTAWEETTGTSLSTGINTVNGVGGSSNITWTMPGDMLPSGLGVQLAWTPRGQSAVTNDKGTGGDAGGYGSGYDIVLDYSGLVDGLNIFGGWSAIEQAAATTGGVGGVMGGADGDRTQKVMGATYATGGFTLGYQYSLDAKQTVKGASTSYYENDAYGISFAINDDLSISYGSHKSDRSLTNGTNVEAEATSVQLAYSMGGASIKIAETSGDNLNYSTATDRDATTLALSLAF